MSEAGTVLGLTPPVFFSGSRKTRQHRGTLISFGESAPVVNYLMLAKKVSDGAWITWAVTTTPDSDGSQAPSEVIADTITFIRRWTT